MMFRTSRMLETLHGFDEDVLHYQQHEMYSAPNRAGTPAGGYMRQQQMSPRTLRTDPRRDRVTSPKFSARFVATNITTHQDAPRQDAARQDAPRQDAARRDATRQDATDRRNAASSYSNQEVPGRPPTPQRPSPTPSSMNRRPSTASVKSFEGSSQQFLSKSYSQGGAIPKPTASTAVPKQSTRNVTYGTASSEKPPTSNLKREKSIHKGVTFSEQSAQNVQHPFYEHESSYGTSESTAEQSEGPDAMRFDGTSDQNNIAALGHRLQQALHNAGEKNLDAVIKQYIDSVESDTFPRQMELHSTKSNRSTRPTENTSNISAGKRDRMSLKLKKSSSDHQVLNKLMDILQRREMQEMKRRKRRLDAKTFANFMEMLDDADLQEKLQENKVLVQQQQGANSNMLTEVEHVSAERRNLPGASSEVKTVISKDSGLPLTSIAENGVDHNQEAGDTNSGSNLVESGTQTAADNPLVCLRFRIAKDQDLKIIGDIQEEISDHPTPSSAEETRHKSRKRQRHHSASSRSESNLKHVKKGVHILSSNDELRPRLGLPSNRANFHDGKSSFSLHNHKPESKDNALSDRYNSEKTDSDGDMVQTSGNWRPTYHDPHAPVQLYPEQRTIQELQVPRSVQDLQVPRSPSIPTQKSEPKIVLTPRSVKLQDISESHESNVYEIVVQLEVDKENKDHNRTGMQHAVNLPKPIERRHAKVSEKYRKVKSEEEPSGGSTTSQSLHSKEDFTIKPDYFNKERLHYPKEGAKESPLPVMHNTTATPGVLGIGAPRLLGVYYNLTSGPKLDTPETPNSTITDSDVPAYSSRRRPSQQLLSVAEREAVHSFQAPTVKLLIDSHETNLGKRPSNTQTEAFKYQNYNIVPTSSESDEPRTSYISASQPKSETSLESEDEIPVQLPLKHSKSRLKTKAATFAAPTVVKAKSIRFSPETTTDDQFRHYKAPTQLSSVNSVPTRHKKNLAAGMQPVRKLIKGTQSRVQAKSSLLVPDSQIQTGDVPPSSATTSEDQRKHGGGSDSDREDIARLPRHVKKLPSGPAFTVVAPRRTKSRLHPSTTSILARSVIKQMPHSLEALPDDQQQDTPSKSRLNKMRHAQPQGSTESQYFASKSPQPTDTSTVESTDKSAVPNDQNIGADSISALTKESAAKLASRKNSSAKHTPVNSGEGIEYGNEFGKSLMELDALSGKSKKSLLSTPDVPDISEKEENVGTSETENDGTQDSSEKDEDIPSPHSSSKVLSFQLLSSPSSSEKVSDIEHAVNVVASAVSSLIGSTKLKDVDLQGEEFLNYVKAAVSDIKRSKSQLEITEEKLIEGSHEKITVTKSSERSQEKVSARKSSEKSQVNLSMRKSAEGSQEKISTRKSAERSQEKTSTRKSAEGSQEKISTRKSAEGSQEKISKLKSAEGSQEKISTRKSAKGSQEKIQTRKSAEGSQEKISTRKSDEGSEVNVPARKPVEESQEKIPMRKSDEGSQVNISTRRSAEGSTEKTPTQKTGEGSRVSLSWRKSAEGSQVKITASKSSEGSHLKLSERKSAEKSSSAQDTSDKSKHSS